MKKIITAIFIFCFLFLANSPGQALSRWESIKTEYFTVFYPPKLEEQAKEVLFIIERYRPHVESICGNRRLHLPVVISDMGINANGSADPVFYRVNLFCYPPKEMGAMGDWLTLVAVHEYTHILQMTNVGQGSKLFTSLFGNIFNPNCMVPGWIYEGIAVYSESTFSEYQGRLNDGKYAAYIGSRAKEGTFPSMLDSMLEFDEFNLDGFYTYGSMFFSYLAKTYGEDKFSEFFIANGSARTSLNNNAKLIFGKTFPELWEDWGKYETERFADFYIDGKRLTNEGWSHKGLLLFNDNKNDNNKNNDNDNDTKLYYQRTRHVKANTDKIYYYQEIIERDLDSEKEMTIVRTTSPFVLPLKIHDGKIYYGVYEYQKGFANTSNRGFGLSALLFAKDLSTGEEQEIFESAIRAYDVLPDGNILFSELNKEKYGSKLYIYEEKVGKRLLYELDYIIDEIIFDNDLAYFVASENGQNNDIYTFSLNTGKMKKIIATPFAESGIALTGDMLFYQANYNQTYNVYCYNLSEEKVYKVTQGGYATQPAYNKDSNELYFVGLSTDGFDIFNKDTEFIPYNLPTEELAASHINSFSEINYVKGNYWDNLKTLFPKVMVPLIYGDEESNGLGLLFLGSDALRYVPLYELFIAYDFQKKNIVLNSGVSLNVIPSTEIYFGYSGGAGRPISLMVDYIFLSRLTPGLTNLSLNTEFNYGKGKGMEVVPEVNLVLRHPGMKTSLSLKTPLERTSWGCNTDRVGCHGLLAIEKNIWEGELLLQAQGIYDPQSSSSVLPKIRGYRDEHEAKIGGFLTLEYGKPVLPIRKKCWVLGGGIGLEDLCADFFIDIALPKNEEMQLAYGFELFQEILLNYSGVQIKLAPGFGIGLNKKGAPFGHLLLKGSF